MKSTHVSFLPLPPLPPLRVDAALLVWASARSAELHPAAGAQAVPRLASQAGVGLQRHVHQALRPVEGVAAENTPRSQPGECEQVEIIIQSHRHCPCWAEQIPPADTRVPPSWGASQLSTPHPQHVLSIFTQTHTQTLISPLNWLWTVSSIHSTSKSGKMSGLDFTGPDGDAWKQICDPDFIGYFNDADCGSSPQQREADMRASSGPFCVLLLPQHEEPHSQK